MSCQTEVDFVSKEEHDKLQENFESLKKEFEKLRREHNDMLVKSAEERAKENEVQLNIFLCLVVLILESQLAAFFFLPMKSIIFNRCIRN